ncbi:hypothetical protein Tco_1382936, partial [Tanacetum coccineum]
EIYRRLDDVQSEQQMGTSRVNMLFRDRRAHARTARLMEIEARMSREAWGWSMDASDLACTDVMALRTQMVAQQSEITELRVANRMRQTQFTEALKLIKIIQTQLTALQSRQGPARAVFGKYVKLSEARKAEDSHNSGTCVEENNKPLESVTYPDFMKRQPQNIKAKNGVAKIDSMGLRKWNCVPNRRTVIVETKSEFPLVTLRKIALTWSNTHLGQFGMTLLCNDLGQN